MIITDVVLICHRSQSLDCFEALLSNLLKTGERQAVNATKQIVDCLVDNILTLDAKMAGKFEVCLKANRIAIAVDENASANSLQSSAAATLLGHQERLLACLTTLNLFSKVRPELMVRHAETLQPYLSMSMNSPVDQQVLNQARRLVVNFVSFGLIV